MASASAEAAVRELFASVVEEIALETGAAAAALSAPRLLGVMADKNRKPDLLFLVHTKLTAEELRGGLEKAEERWESDQLRRSGANPRMESQ